MRTRGKTTLSVLVPVLVLAAASIGLGACGGPDPEAELAAATEKLSEARAAVEAARNAVEEKKARVEKARAELEASRRELSEAEKRVAKAASRVDLRATDDVLFRTVQRRLLEDEKLEKVAVKATVSNGVVTLTGRVPKPKLAERAVDIASTTTGVVRVESRIQVDPPPVASE